MTMPQVTKLRTTMPEGTTVMMIKNRSFKKSVQKSEFEASSPTAVVRIPTPPI